MSTSYSNTNRISFLVYDNVVNHTTSLEKYTQTVLEAQRLRGNDSLASPGFTFYDTEELYSEISYLGLNQNAELVVRDGFYSLDNSKHLLFGNRSAFEIFNFSSLYTPSETSFKHLCSFIPDGEHIEVCTFQRNGKKYFKRSYVQKERFTCLPEYTNAFSYPSYLTERMDTSQLEFVLDRNFATSKEIVINQLDQITSLFSSTETNMAPWTSVLDHHYSTNHEVIFPYFPLDSSFSQVFTWDSASTNLLEWTQTNNIPGTATGRFYTLNSKEGIAYLNTSITSYGTAFVGYKTLPAVHYYLKHTDTYHESDQTIDRIIEDVKQGSYWLAIEESNNEEKQLSINVENANDNNSVWEGLFYNQPYKKIEVSLYEKKSLNPIPSEKVSIEVLNSIGKLQNKVGYTDQEGKVSFYFKPPTLSEAFLNVSTSASTSVVHSSIQYLDTNMNNMYLYSIWKDDPLIGSTSTSTNFESQTWDSNKLNGRRVIFYQWNTSVYNPVTSTQGAFAPVRPVSIDGTTLHFGTSLPSYSATDHTIKVGGLSLVGDLKSQLRVSTIDQTSNFQIKNSLSREQRGEIEYLGKRYSMGFRLYSESLSVADSLDGAVYLTINPFNSNYTILFEGGLYRDISNNIDFNFTLV